MDHRAASSLSQQFDGVVDTLEKLQDVFYHAPELSALHPDERLWLEDFTTALLSWGADVRTDSASFKEIEGTALSKQIALLLQQCEKQIEVAFVSLFEQSLEEVPWIQLERLGKETLGDLRSLTKTIRMFYANTHQKGPYATMKQEINRLHSESGQSNTQSLKSLLAPITAPSNSTPPDLSLAVPGTRSKLSTPKGPPDPSPVTVPSSPVQKHLLSASNSKLRSRLSQIISRIPALKKGSGSPHSPRTALTSEVPTNPTLSAPKTGSYLPRAAAGTDAQIDDTPAPSSGAHGALGFSDLPAATEDVVENSNQEAQGASPTRPQSKWADKPDVLRQSRQLEISPGPSLSESLPKPRTQFRSSKDEEMASTSRDSRRSSTSDSQVWKESVDYVNHKVESEVLSIAAEIDCRPVVYMCGEHLLPNKVVPIKWLEEGQYKVISKEIVGRIKGGLKRSHGNAWGSWPKPYRLSADVRLLIVDDKGVEKLLESDTVHHQGHWAQKVPVLVARHGSQNPFSKLLLEVVWHYDTIDVRGQHGKTLAQKICQAVYEKRKLNWREQWFLSTADLDAIFSEEIIRELINNDGSLSKELLEPDRPRTEEALQRWTPEWLFLNASGLLATCIWARLPLSCLRQLVIDHGKTDVDRPLIAAPAGVDAVEFDALRMEQRMFWVYNFDDAKLKKQLERGTYEVIENWQTVPIINKGTIGGGGFGLVSEVSIYPGHHTFKDDTFALKQLHHTVHTAQDVSRAFARENNVFSNLMGIKHRNILVPLAMWRQEDPGYGDKFNMLYSKAKCNLVDHLRSFKTPPRLEKQFVEHLIQQVRDLADALEKIHALRKHSGLFVEQQQQVEPLSEARQTSISWLQPPSAETERYRTACHHDLKPENILIFEDDAWKISDFGTPAITQAVSGSSVVEMADLQSGDPIYSPPDHAMGERTARAYDIWCFGCILLEILLTLFYEATPGEMDETQIVHRLDTFYMERANSVQSVSPVALFWYRKMDKDGTYKFELREPVKQRFKMLYRQTKAFDQFPALVQLAEDMMSIRPRGRGSAERALARLKLIQYNITNNLSANENFYLSPGNIAQRWASRPLTDRSSVSFAQQTDQLTNKHTLLRARHLPLPEAPRARRNSDPGKALALLERSAKKTFEILPIYQIALEKALASPAAQKQDDNISMWSTAETAVGDPDTATYVVY